MGNHWRNAFETWMKALLAGRRAAIAAYYTQILHSMQISLSNMAVPTTDVAEKSALLPLNAFHSDLGYPH